MSDTKCDRCKGEGRREVYKADGLHAGADVMVECSHCDGKCTCSEGCCAEDPCEVCGKPAVELSQRMDLPGIVDVATGTYRARWACAACGGG